MCARYSLTAEELTIIIGEIEVIIKIGARYNIAPKQIVPAILNEAGKPRAVEMSWGWLRQWSLTRKSSSVRQ